jgi:hypothetical protein
MRKEKKNRFVWVLPAFIVFIMVFSVFMVGNTGTGQSKYNGYKIKYLENGFEIEAGKTQIFSQYHPADMEIIKAPAVSSFDFTGKQAVLTFDPEQKNLEYTDYARYDLSKFLNQIGVQTIGATTKQSNYTMPVADCSDATANITIIKFAQSNETKITKEGFCYILESAYPADAVRVETRFKLTIIGVMNASSSQ